MCVVQSRAWRSSAAGSDGDVDHRTERLQSSGVASKNSIVEVGDFLRLDRNHKCVSQLCRVVVGVTFQAAIVVNIEGWLEQALAVHTNFAVDGVFPFPGVSTN